MSIFSLVLFGFIEGGALGFAHDPLAEGISFKLGTKQGFYGHLILNFETGETKVDSAKYFWHPENYDRETEYKESFWRPYFWVNFGLRIERYFTRKSWYQPYIGVGIEGTKESNWWEKHEHEYEDTTSTVIPKLAETSSYGPTGVIGMDFYPLLLLSKLARFELPFSDAISFNIEIFTFYLFRPEPDWRRQKKYSEIGWGAGIHFNW
ncbi:hypothetical protein KAW50_08085 [candidate division WOR-3 bacterium]|nr:hypothetical protein [candidate division WOR-3 bacterium]